ncbi:hypothetical protein BT67DRAFT_36580 [Trichocladium antarcticum]|uniref:Uncharacterized protein n=1 Tax=Trichocladium antarcticum TaxID=1450529 RepID=A0AAN6ZCG5_9PEZI|nr:hypothetical protein BT67DRAFT_36580 [Trichocladium antarcticum]
MWFRVARTPTTDMARFDSRIISPTYRMLGRCLLIVCHIVDQWRLKTHVSLRLLARKLRRRARQVLMLSIRAKGPHVSEQQDHVFQCSGAFSFGRGGLSRASPPPYSSFLVLLLRPSKLGVSSSKKLNYGDQSPGVLQIELILRPSWWHIEISRGQAFVI